MYIWCIYGVYTCITGVHRGVTYVRDVHPVDADPPVEGVVEAEEEPSNRRLTAPRVPDDGCRCSRIHRETHLPCRRVYRGCIEGV